MNNAKTCETHKVHYDSSYLKCPVCLLLEPCFDFVVALQKGDTDKLAVCSASIQNAVIAMGKNLSKEKRYAKSI